MGIRDRETIVADTGFPLAILHAVGNDGVDGGSESAEEELGQCSECIERNGRRNCTEEIAVSYTHLDVYKRQGLTA